MAWTFALLCDVCETPAPEPGVILPGDNRRWAVRGHRLRAEEQGWRKIDGKWHCRTCARIALCPGVPVVVANRKDWP